MLFNAIPVAGALLALASSTAAVSFAPSDASYPGFKCEYPSLRGWKACNNRHQRDCWVRQTPAGRPFKGQHKLDIHTEYETITPPGVVREYWLDLDELGDDQQYAPDGFLKTKAKVFNGSYPGPLIEACWGDQIVVHVKNNLPDNGTTIHWHGIRQLHSNEMDGVNGVTQCPIALGSTYTYNFTAEQYGHSWYHSHYSLQYGDGAAGPLLIHGPTSDDWDEAVDPVIIADWVHPTAFSLMDKELNFQNGLPQSESILFNGTGHFHCPDPSDPGCVGGGKYFETVFKKGKRYLFRLINGSVNAFFNFSIDNHKLKVVSNDFVAITPYEAADNNILIGIGQRYAVVVEALEDTDITDFWIRTEPATGCSDFSNYSTLVNTTGIVRYDASSTSDPTSTGPTRDGTCHDEPYDKLIPIVPWTVDSESVNDVEDNTFLAGLDFNNAELPGNVSRWELTDYPMFLNFSDPTVLNLDKTNWERQYAVIHSEYKSGFVYLVITANQTTNEILAQTVGKTAIPAAHPIHLHGHDFAVIGQSTEPYDAVTAQSTWHFDNPPRRDVALLPSGGYLAIAFKPDNPGVWLLHCHIAWHASSGLALQIIERQDEIEGNIGPLDPVSDGCTSWDNWHLDYIQDDSGI